jgi:voltage-gated potassium channel
VNSDLETSPGISQRASLDLNGAQASASLKRRVYEVLEARRSNDILSKVFETLILSLIALNVVALIIETVKSVYIAVPWVFQDFELISVIVFSAEYALRLWSCTESPEYSSPILGRLRFALTPLAIIDLIAFLPFYLPFFSANLLFIRAIRLFRLFRVAKAARYSNALSTFGSVILRKKEELAVAFMLLVLAVVFASALMYFAENQAQPDDFSSIPATMWWAIETLTTVGYGDVYPVTVVGKLMAAVLAVLGIAVFALPTAILGAGFIEEFQQRHRRHQNCPHCGKDIGL